MARPLATIIVNAYLKTLGTLGHKFFLSIRYRKLKNIATKIHITNEKVPLPTIYTAMEYKNEIMTKITYISLNLRITYTPFTPWSFNYFLKQNSCHIYSPNNFKIVTLHCF